MPDFEKTKRKMHLKQAVAQGIILLKDDSQIEALDQALKNYLGDPYQEDHKDALRAIYPFGPNDLDDTTASSLLALFSAVQADKTARMKVIIAQMYRMLKRDLDDYLSEKQATNASDITKGDRRGKLKDEYQALTDFLAKQTAPTTIAESNKIFDSMPKELTDFITFREDRMQVKQPFVEIAVMGRSVESKHIKQLYEDAVKAGKMVKRAADGSDDGKELAMIDLRENYTPTGKPELTPVHLTVAYNPGFNQKEILHEMINRFDGHDKIEVSGCKEENPYTHLRFESFDKKDFAVCGQEVDGEIRYLKFEQKAYDDFASTAAMKGKPFQAVFNAFKAQTPSLLSSLTSSDYSSPLKGGPYEGCLTVRELIRKCPVLLAKAMNRNVYESHPAKPATPTPPGGPAAGATLVNPASPTGLTASVKKLIR